MYDETKLPRPNVFAAIVIAIGIIKVIAFFITGQE